MRPRFYLNTFPISPWGAAPPAWHVPTFDQLFLRLWRMQAYTTDVCTFTGRDAPTCWNVNVRTWRVSCFFFFFKICTCEHLVSCWMCFNADCPITSWETGGWSRRTFALMHRSIANPRWTSELMNHNEGVSVHRTNKPFCPGVFILIL